MVKIKEALQLKNDIENIVVSYKSYIIQSLCKEEFKRLYPDIFQKLLDEYTGIIYVHMTIDTDNKNGRFLIVNKHDIMLYDKESLLTSDPNSLTGPNPQLPYFLSGSYLKFFTSHSIQRLFPELWNLIPEFNNWTIAEITLQ